MQQALETFLNTIESTPSLLALDGALRYVFPLLALVILLRCGKSLLLFRREPEVWAWLAGPTGDRCFTIIMFSSFLVILFLLFFCYYSFVIFLFILA